MSDSTTPEDSRASQPTPPSGEASPGAPTQFSGAPAAAVLSTQPLSPPHRAWFSTGLQDRLRTGALPTLLQPNYSASPPSATPASQRPSQQVVPGSHRPWWGFSDGDDVNLPEPRRGGPNATATAGGDNAGRAPATQSAAPAASLGSQETLPGDATRGEEGVEESTAERGDAGEGSGGVGGAAPLGWRHSQGESQAGQGHGESSQEPMDTREAGDRSKVARSLRFDDTPGRARQRQGCEPTLHAPQRDLHQTHAAAITPEQARRAEANRQAALAKRRQRLEAQAINLFAAQPAGSPPPREHTSRIYDELNRVLIAQRRGPAPILPGPSSSAPSPLQSRPSPQGAPLTPKQRERMERSRQEALQRQAARAAAEAAAIMARAEREGLRVQQERVNAAASVSRAASQQQQRRQSPASIDQSWQRFV